jgi:hypothetical protein
MRSLTDVCDLLLFVSRLSKWKGKNEAISPDRVEEVCPALKVGSPPPTIQILKLLLDTAIERCFLVQFSTSVIIHQLQPHSRTADRDPDFSLLIDRISKLNYSPQPTANAFAEWRLFLAYLGPPDRIVSSVPLGSSRLSLP